jgi:hypothetical protein
MRKIPVIVAMFLMFTVVSSALAAGYGAAGCGFGGLVIKENRILPQIGAWFLNGLYGNQTFAMTSGTSECGGKKGVTANGDQEQFVKNNYDSLAKEMAVGAGEGLNTLSDLLGCPAERHENFASYTQQNYPALFKDETTAPAEMLATLKKGLSSEPVFASSCNKI